MLPLTLGSGDKKGTMLRAYLGEMRSNEPRYTVLLNVSMSFCAFILMRIERRVSDGQHVPVPASIYHRAAMVCQAMRKSVTSERLRRISVTNERLDYAIFVGVFDLLVNVYCISTRRADSKDSYM
jgi:hypothetical protein